MLELKNISKSFPQRGVVLDNLNFQIIDNKVIAITGPSGSGKSTLLNIIGALEKPDSGEVCFMGKQLNAFKNDEEAEYRNRNIGFVFQEHLLLPHLSVIQNITLPFFAVKRDKNEYNDCLAYAGWLMSRVNITGLGNKFPHEISGGEAQRVSLIRALINRPKLLLADEPTGSLDEKNAEILTDLLISINEATGVSMLVVTHSEKVAVKLPERYHLDNGKLLKIS